MDAEFDPWAPIKRKSHLKPRDIAAINVQPQPIKGSPSSYVSAQANALKAVTTFDMPVAVQGTATPYPMKQQGIRSMKHEARAVYVEGELERIEKQERVARRADMRSVSPRPAVGTITVYLDGKVRVEKAPSKKLPKKPRVKKTSTPTPETLAQIARLANVGYAPRKFQASDRIGKAS